MTRVVCESIAWNVKERGTGTTRMMVTPSTLPWFGDSHFGVRTPMQEYGAIQARRVSTHVQIDVPSNVHADSQITRCRDHVWSLSLGVKIY